MKRKITVLTLWVLLLALWLPAEAQQPTKVARIGYQSAGSSGEREEAFRQGLRELGHVEGQKIVIEWRFAQGKPDQVPRNAAELVRLKVDVIGTGGATDTRAAKAATSTIPIVMTNESDPVGNGLVASLARPGGNITGLASLSAELNGKRLELLNESQNCPGRGSLRSGHSRHGTRDERGSPSRGERVEVDDSVLGGTRCGQFR